MTATGPSAGASTRLREGTDIRTPSVVLSDPVYGGSVNAYEYGYADPVNKFDPDGKWVPLVVFGAPATWALLGASAAYCLLSPFVLPVFGTREKGDRVIS
ncbi:hypothetical protein [Streptomyces sp. NPDC050388]|uniref:hypothetical protein n=1 Tax=Streptomyces sp. NPDC050388 TaxID=3155781 RepID=UPI00343DD143